MGTPGIDALRALLTANDRYADWCTWAVFVGLIVEYTILLFPKWKDLSPSERRFTVLAGLAIAGGVWGEAHFGSVAAKAALQLEQISEQRVADAELGAAGANALAQSASLQAAGFNLEAAELRKKLADRHVTVEQRKKMLPILAAGRGTPISVGYITGSGTDSQEYSLELAEVFCDAKWVVSMPFGPISDVEPRHGFLLDVQPPLPPSPNSHAVQPPTPPSKKVVSSVKEALDVTGYKTVMQPPSFGFTTGGEVFSCKNPPPPQANTPPWYPTALELLVGSK